MTSERTVGGIRCFEVLERLSDYIDGELDEATRGRVEAHLAQCDWCARFGGDVASTVNALRETLGAPAPMPPASRDALDASLRRALGAAPVGDDVPS